MEIEDILRDYGGMLSRIVASYEADPALQQEIMQDVSLAIWQALKKIRDKDAVKAYVARIAQNRCISHVAKAAALPKSIELTVSVACSASDPETDINRQQQRSELLAAVRTLPLSLRQVTTLALEGFSHRETAEALGISENNAMVRFSRAKSELRRIMIAQSRGIA